jgi:hypothetical protein
MVKVIKPVLLILAVFFSLCSFSQDFVYKAGYFGFFDNREYFNEYVNDQTIFGSRVSGEVGYAFDANNRIMAGIDYLYEFGSKEWVAPDFTAYYYGHSRKTTLFLGAFPRTSSMNMPFALFSDTFRYFRPNTEGIWLEFNTPSFRQNIWIDWTGRQSYDRKEAFLIGMSGFFSKGLFCYQHHLIVSHLAHTTNTIIDEHIRDNAGFTVLPGLDFSEKSGLDSLSIYAGILGSADRQRGIYEFSFPLGFLGEAVVEYRNFGFHGIIYAGDRQVITSGDGLYQAEFYSRLDAYYQKKNKHIQGKVQLSMHLLPDVVDLSMSLTVSATINGSFRNAKNHLPNP